MPPAGSVHPWTDAAGPFRGHDYTGEPVSISLDCAELLDLFKLLGHITGLEFRPSPDVAGCVDVFATERPWDEVLESVLAAASLEHRIEGSKVFVTSTGTPGVAADLRLMALLRKDGSWLAFAHGQVDLPVAGIRRRAHGLRVPREEAGLALRRPLEVGAQRGGNVLVFACWRIRRLEVSYTTE